MPDEQFRPGCFGSPVCYKLGHVVCTPCPFATQCAPIALARLEILHVRYGIKPKPTKPAKKAKPVAPAKPKPSKLELVANALRVGKNPFNEKNPAHKSWWLVCEVLLRKPTKAVFAAFASLIAKLLSVEIVKAAEHVRGILTQLMQSGAVVKRADLYAIQ